MSNSYLLQGERMDLNLGSFTIPAASLQLFDSACIIVLVPLMDRVVFPLLDRCNLRPSLLKKIGQYGWVWVRLGTTSDSPPLKKIGQYA